RRHTISKRDWSSDVCSSDLAHSRDLVRGDSPHMTTEGVTPVGRGRAKAKQIKVARKLKYYSPDTDLDQLQQELGSDSRKSDSSDPYDDDPDYSAYADKYNVDDDDEYEDEHDEDGAPSERIRRQPARAVTTTLRAGTAVPALSRLLVRLPGITHRRSSLLGRGTRLRGYCRIAAPPSTP